MAANPESLDPGLESDEEWTVPEWTIYDCLRQARKKAGIHSMKVMAELLSREFGQSIKETTAAAWERGTNQPTKSGIRFDLYVKAYSSITRTPLSYFYPDPSTGRYLQYAQVRGALDLIRCDIAGQLDFDDAPRYDRPAERHLSTV